MGVQILTTEEGSELVVLSRHDYDMLLARAGDDDAEDCAAAHLVRAARAAREARGGTMLPGWLSAAILAGEHPIRAARKRAGLSQVELARRAGIGQGQLSDVETGRKGIGAGTLAAVAAALGAEAEWLAD